MLGDSTYEVEGIEEDEDDGKNKNHYDDDNVDKDNNDKNSANRGVEQRVSAITWVSSMDK